MEECKNTYVIDDEYADGRMTWETIKVKWIRE